MDSPTKSTKVALRCLKLCVGMALLTSCFMCYVNTLAYPGAHALAACHRVTAPESTDAPTQPATQRIFIDAYAGMTGVTRFVKRVPMGPSLGSDRTVQWVYSKDPDVFNRTSGQYGLPCSPEVNSASCAPFDCIIVRHEDLSWHNAHGIYDLVENVNMFERINFQKWRVETSAFLAVMQPKKRTAP